MKPELISVIVPVFAAKLSIGTLFDEHLRRGGQCGFHQYVAAVNGI
jgi:hypothetical protein